MILRSFALAVFSGALGFGGAWAQSAEEPVQTAPPPLTPTVAAPEPVAVRPLAVLDLFSPGAPGLGPDLWKGSSAALARTVIPTLAAKPLTPAFAALGRKVLSTGASGPEDGGADRDLAAARVAGLLALGDAQAASAILDQSSLSASPALSRTAAEAALILGDDDKACRIADALGSGRDGVYWLRLRSFCQARAGETAAAQLTLDLAEAQAKDPVYRRLMTVLIAGAGGPGAASARNGLELALSRKLALDLTPAMDAAAPAVRRRLAPEADAALDAPALEAAALRGLGDAPVPADVAAAAYYVALGNSITPTARAHLADVDLGRGNASQGRLLSLQQAAAAGAKGDTALLALAIAADAGVKGPSVADRADIIGALMAVGLGDDARAIAAEGFTGGKAP